MKTKRFYLTLLISIFFSSMAFGEFLISVDSGIVIDLHDGPLYSPNMGFSGSADTYKLLDDYWSLFVSGEGELIYLPIDNLWFYGLEFQGDISFRKNRKLVRFSIYSDYEGENRTPFSYMGLTPELYYSMEIGDCTVFTTHSITMDFATADDLSYDGDMGISFLVSPTFILDPHIAGGVVHEGTGNEFYQDTTLDYSWYPGVPLVLDGSLGFFQYFSTSPYYELYFDNELTISLGTPVQLVISMPSTLQFYRDFSEIRLIFLPEIAVDFTLRKNGILVLTAGSQIENEFTNREFYSSLFFSLKLMFSLY